MKITELRELESEMIEGLRTRAAGGDNHAAQVLLEHLRAVSLAISKWKAEKDSQEEQTKTTKQKTT